MQPHILLYGQPHQFPNYERALVQAGAVVRFGGGEGCDGLLLPGGGDIHPDLYGAAWYDSRDVDVLRDLEELALCRAFIAQGKPVLGVCRGLQVLNVALGGTLCQHVEGHSGRNGRDGFHPVLASPDSFIDQLYGRSFAVNTAHHQALGKLGYGLEAVQWAADGVIEAAEHRTLPLWGVQWHPERLRDGGRRTDTVDGGRIFRFFVDRCPH